MPKFSISTKKKQELIDITDRVAKLVHTSDVEDGVCVVFTKHTTSAIVITENYDPGIKEDILESLSKLIPRGGWRHDKVDGDADAHIKSAIINPSITIPVVEGRMTLGRWQGIYLVELSGPREREVVVLVR